MTVQYLWIKTVKKIEGTAQIHRKKIFKLISQFQSQITAGHAGVV